jgi:predicted site-specific integrase-resolvase
MVDEIFDWVPREKNILTHYGVTNRHPQSGGHLGFRRTPETWYHYALPKAGQDKSMQRIYHLRARVSSGKQGDLPQAESISCAVVSRHRVITDIGSGVNFQRRGLRPSGRLNSRPHGSCWFARSRLLAQNRIRLLEHLSPVRIQFSRSLKIMLATDVPQNSTNVMAVLTHFTAKHHGRRSACQASARSRSQAVGENPPDGGTEGDLP